MSEQREYEVVIEITRYETFLVLGDSKQQLTQKYRDVLDPRPWIDGTFVAATDERISHVTVRRPRLSYPDSE